MLWRGLQLYQAQATEFTCSFPPGEASRVQDILLGGMHRCLCLPSAACLLRIKTASIPIHAPSLGVNFSDTLNARVAQYGQNLGQVERSLLKPEGRTLSASVQT